MEKSEIPCRELYIYQLYGPVSESDEARLGDEFMGNWVEDDMSFLFFRAPADTLVERLLREDPRLEFMERHRFPYEQWQGEVAGPLEVDRFRIVPPWVRSGPREGHVVIRLDPGVVFGTGLHPTTRDCLKALGIARDHRPFHSVLDVGTGTGILGIAAALLGAGRVLAVDLNPLCVKTAVQNVKRNRLEGAIRVRRERAEDMTVVPADLLIANIHYDVLKKLLAQGFVRPFQRIILSGLMRSQVQDVKMELRKNNTEIIREWDHEMTWYTLLAVCRSSQWGATRPLLPTESCAGRKPPPTA